MQEQEDRKEKWKVFSKIFDFIHCFDPDYSPLDDAVTNVDKMRKLMNNFPEIIEVMNEKKQFFIWFYLDKAKEVMGRLGFTPNIRAGQLTVQKRPGYTIVQNKKNTVDKRKQIIESTSRVLEERPTEPSPKRRKIIREEDSHVEEYSPSQTPLRTGEEQLTIEKIEQTGSQGGVFVTQAEIDEGNPQEPPMPCLEMIVADFKGMELDPILEQASQQFLLDHRFVRSRAFHQFAWRENIHNFEERCKNMKKSI